MKELQKIQEFFSKPLEEAKEETAINMAKKQLDALGVEYELGNKFKPFKIIYKPIGKSDKFYDTFNDIVDLFNLGNAVESSMNEVNAKYSRKNQTAPQEIKEDAFEDTWALNRRKVQSFIDQYKDNSFRKTDIKYAQAYLNIDDLVDANKYWNNFNLKKITDSISSMESLKELVKNIITEKKKKKKKERPLSENSRS